MIMVDEIDDGMENQVYKVVEIVGTSSESVSNAIDNAIARASETVDNIGWFEVMEQRGRVEDNEVAEFQVKIKVGFRLED
jgi:flavin-binding protein dodecin